MKPETRICVRTCIVGVATVVVVVLAVIVPILGEIRETMTVMGSVRIENALGDAIVLEDMRSGQQLARIPPLSNWSAQFDLADSEDGKSMTTFRIVLSDGRWATVESRTFLFHLAEVRDHGLDLRAMAGKEARTVTETIEWNK